MIKKSIFSVMFLLFIGIGASNAQQYEEYFKEMFPEFSGSLKTNGEVAVTPENLPKYRDAYKKLNDCFKEVKIVENGGGSPETVKTFDYGRINKIVKKGEADKMKALLKSNQEAIKILLRDQEFGADKGECTENLSNFNNLYKQKDYDGAYKHWNTLYKYYPASNRIIYVYGAKLIKKKIKTIITAAKKETDAEKQKELLSERQAWIDTLLMMSDDKAKYFPKYKGTSIAAKGKDIYVYRVKKAFTKEEKEAVNANLATSYKLLKESIEIEKAKSSPVIVQYFFFASSKMYKTKQIEADQVVKDYNFSQATLEARQKYYNDRTEKLKINLKRQPEHANAKKWEKSIAKNDKKVANAIKISDLITDKFAKGPYSQCSVLIPTFSPKFEENKENIKWLKQVTDMLLSKSKKDSTCTDCDLYEKSIIALYKLEPSAKAAYKLAAYYLKKKPEPDYDNASKYFEEAYTQETDSLQKAKYYYQAALVAQVKKQYSKARSLAYDALKYNPKNGNPYILIAQLYVATRSSCGSNPFEKRWAYWAAVDKLQKAKSIDPSIADKANKLIGRYSGGYPRAEEGNKRDVLKGSTVKVGGWIQETTTVRYVK